VAPEADATSIRGDQPLRAEVDIDSMDYLNFLVEIHRELGVDVPEADYARVATLDALVAYLAGRVRGDTGAPEPNVPPRAG
jgi:acyl carrier protein